MSFQVDNFAAFFLHLDELKTVERRTYVRGGERRENSAEHSWHLAMACWCYAESLHDDFDVDRLIKLALVHDLGEIGAGDTFLYADTREVAHVAKRESVGNTAAFAGNAISDLVQLWEEQETGTTKEAVLLKVMDRLLPFLHNITSNGRAWQENGICKSQVLKMHGFIADESPEIWSWLTSKVEAAVEQGWLDAS
ncbi:HD domain-containing protein [Congregibacter litoralis]|uniref:5'-deoxynucleotidase n=1 Tax=Congregibacter litoralis KT71 TaxID=314285 RepID=A4A4Q0_9GAMM|nr:HD domain-containing protein [Congregibacter litoralis]EAQ98771.1 putative hydrolase of HD superfamily [Congregibacter litoralis KT71]